MSNPITSENGFVHIQCGRLKIKWCGESFSQCSTIKKKNKNRKQTKNVPIVNNKMN